MAMFGGISFDFSSLTFHPEDMPAFSDKKEKEFIRKAKIRHKPIIYKNALDMAQAMDIREEYFCLVSGSFIYGDFIEALCDIHRLRPRRVLITTLGLNQNNVDSLVNLVDYLGAKEVGLVVSTYFYDTEKTKLLPYMMEEFAGRPMSVAVCASHTKICLIDSESAGKIVMFGSANLSSSDNLEEFALIHDGEVFAFCEQLITGVLRDFKIYDGLTRKARFEQKGNRSNKMFEKAIEYTAAGGEEQ